METRARPVRGTAAQPPTAASAGRNAATLAAATAPVIVPQLVRGQPRASSIASGAPVCVSRQEEVRPWWTGAGQRYAARLRTEAPPRRHRRRAGALGEGRAEHRHEEGLLRRRPPENRRAEQQRDHDERDQEQEYQQLTHQPPEQQSRCAPHRMPYHRQTFPANYALGDQAMPPPVRCRPPHSRASARPLIVAPCATGGGSAHHGRRSPPADRSRR